MADQPGGGCRVATPAGTGRQVISRTCVGDVAGPTAVCQALRKYGRFLQRSSLALRGAQMPQEPSAPGLTADGRLITIHRPEIGCGPTGGRIDSQQPKPCFRLDKQKTARIAGLCRLLHCAAPRGRREVRQPGVCPGV